jgi:flavin-dependent dehydrogenase
MISTKVCIIGAGPAGLVASMFLSKHGVPHILIDKETFPRHKVCGECYDGRVTRILNEVDDSLIPSMLEQHIIQNTNYYSVSRAQRLFNIIYPTENRVQRIQTDRYRFDFFLLNFVKKSPLVQIFENQTVTKIERQTDAIIIKGRNTNFEVKADLLIFACGSDSRLAERFLGDTRTPSDNHYIYQRRYFQLKQPFPNKSVTFAFELKPFNHKMVFCPTPDNKVNVEVEIHKDDYHRFKPNLKQIISDFIEKKVYLKAIFKDAVEIYTPIGTSMTLHNPASRYTGERFIIVGDAAFSSNPVAGLGVGQAMTMGKFASLKAIECIENQDFSANNLNSFDEQIQERFDKEIKFGKLLTGFFKKPQLVDFLYWICTFSPRFSRLLTKIFYKIL